jgi:hypothetical protein
MLVIVALAAVAALVIARFELLCLRELAGTPDVDLRYLNRTGWTTVIVLAIPLGGIAFLYLERTG